ncbi:MAG: hypothetical protein RL187_366 [Actinomycetota bacterium]
MVTDSAGRTQGSLGTSEGITRGVDRALLSLLREMSDVVVVGATTVRRESVPLPRSTPLVVLTRSGNLDSHQLRSRGFPNERLIVVVPPEHQQRASAGLGDVAHELLPWNLESPGALLDEIRTHTAARHVLVEGGRTTWEFFAPETDELLVSSTPPPKEAEGGIPPWWPSSSSPWSLAGLLTDDAKMLYYRYQADPGGAPSAS